MLRGVRIKIAVSAIAGLFVTLGLVWQAEAFFSRDQWASGSNNGGGAATQTLVVNNPAPTVTGGGSTTGGASGIASGGQQPTVVNPEPSTVLLLASGLMAMGLWRRKQRNI